MRYGNDDQQERARFAIRRTNQRWHVVATIDGDEHTHDRGFHEQRDAYDLRDEIRFGFQRGAELNLRHWDTVQL